MAKESIGKLIKQGTEILEFIDTNLNEAITAFKSWRVKVESELLEIKITNGIVDSIKVALHYKQNKFSDKESKRELTETIQNVILLLDKLEGKFEEISETLDLSESAMLSVIRRILNNFYLYIKEMYQEKTHGRGTLLQEDLSKIVIGNEYDVQRMLYSLIRTIFPTARAEFNDDTGYRGIRYDIVIPSCNAIIEVKCSRSNMTERTLTEELGADGFHYKTKNLFIFIYDKEKIIKNSEAFKETYKRDIGHFDKNVEVFILQPISI